MGEANDKVEDNVVKVIEARKEGEVGDVAGEGDSASRCPQPEE
jgi:hypothetical protein